MSCTQGILHWIALTSTEIIVYTPDCVRRTWTNGSLQQTYFADSTEVPPCAGKQGIQCSGASGHQRCDHNACVPLLDACVHFPCSLEIEKFLEFNIRTLDLWSNDPHFLLVLVLIEVAIKLVCTSWLKKSNVSLERCSSTWGVQVQHASGRAALECYTVTIKVTWW